MGSDIELTIGTKSFARSATGLSREIGPVTAILVSISFTIGWGWQIILFYFTGASPLPENMWLVGIPPGVMAILIAGIVVLISMLAFTVLTTAMPRSGGGYVAISRVLSPFWGFIVSWMEFIAISLYFGQIAVSVFERAFTVGPALGIISAEVNDVSVFIGGLILIVAFTAIIALGGIRVTSFILQPLVWIPVILTGYVVYLLSSAIANPSVLQNGISAWAQAQGMPPVTADAVVKAALKQGLDEASIRDYWAAVSNLMVGGYFAYLGYAATTYIAGEVKDASKKLPKILLVIPLIIIFAFVTMALLLTYASASVGQITLQNGDKWSFFEAYSFLSWGGGNLSQAGLPLFRANGAIIAGMSGIGLGLGSLNILVFLFAILWIVNDIPAMVLTASRIMFAMSFDRVLPASFGSVSKRFHSPVNATIAVGVFAVLGCLGESGVLWTGGSWSPGGTIGNLLNSIFSNGFYATDLVEQAFLTFFAIALVLLPYRRKRIYEAAPFKPGGRLGVTAIGVAGVTANLIFVWLVLASPQDSYNILAPNSDNLFALGFDLLLGLIGALIYAYFRRGPSRKDVDYATIFSEIPPE